jgi:hypothetical protein
MLSGISKRLGLHSMILLFVMALPSTSQAEEIVLYDASLSSTPGNQGWIEAVTGAATQSVAAGRLFLDTTADMGDVAGYASEVPEAFFIFSDGSLEHPAMPVLDRAAGFGVDLVVQILTENHLVRDDNIDGKDDRAGFSLIAISQDLFGIEIGFFEDRVFAYAGSGEGVLSSFTQAEFALIDTTADDIAYRLAVLGGGYQLYADDNPILSGSLRNYSSEGAVPNPYDNPSFLFFGDDTSSASSSAAISRVAASVSEPSVFLLFMSGALMFVARARRRLR